MSEELGAASGTLPFPALLMQWGWEMFGGFRIFALRMEEVRKVQGSKVYVVCWVLRMVHMVCTME